MSVLRVMGTETEYGISVPGQPGANAMVTSSQIVNAYQAATAAKARRARWDFEEENPLRDARGFDLTREAADSSQLTDEDLAHVDELDVDRGGQGGVQLMGARDGHGFGSELELGHARDTRRMLLVGRREWRFGASSEVCFAPDEGDCAFGHEVQPRAPSGLVAG